MNSTGGVVLIMGGVMALYLIWAANSPFNRGQSETPPPSNPGGGGGGGGGGGWTPPSISPPNLPGINPIYPIPLPGWQPPNVNPTDVCNPVYTAIWGDYECRVKQGRQNIPGTQIPYTPIGYVPYGYGSTPYGYVGGGWPIGTPYGRGVI